MERWTDRPACTMHTLNSGKVAVVTVPSHDPRTRHPYQPVRIYAPMSTWGTPCRTHRCARPPATPMHRYVQTTPARTCMYPHADAHAPGHVSLLPSRRDMMSTPHQCPRIAGHPMHVAALCTGMPHTSLHSHTHAHGTVPRRCFLLPCPCIGSCMRVPTYGCIRTMHTHLPGSQPLQTRGCVCTCTCLLMHLHPLAHAPAPMDLTIRRLAGQ